MVFRSKLISIIVIGIFSYVKCYGQSDTLKIEEVMIVKAYEPAISDAFKMNTNPKIVETKIEKPQIKYNILKKQIKTSYAINPIKPAKMRGEPLSKLNRGYAILGFGNYVNTYADLFINNGRSRKYSWGGRLKHFASNGTVSNRETTQFSANSVGFYGKRFFRKHLMTGEIGYDRRVNNYYGLEDAIWEDLEAKKLNPISTPVQRYHNVGGKFGFKSFYKDSAKINFDNTLRVNNQFDVFGTNELYGKATGRLSRYFDNEKGILDYSVDYNNYKSVYAFNYAELGDSIGFSSSNAIIVINPKLRSEGKKWLLMLGLSTQVQMDNNAEFHFYPDAEFRYKVVSDMLIVYAGANGGLQRVNYRSVSLENPFIDPNFELRNQNNKLNIYGGIRGAFSSEVSFNIKYSTATVENMLFYVNDTVLYGNSFNAVYDTIALQNIAAELTLHSTNKLDVILRGDYFMYRNSSLLEVWHKPAYRASLMLHYDLKDKLVFKSNVFVVSGRIARSFDSSDGPMIAYNIYYEKRLKPIIDINLSLEYRLNKKFSCFLAANNLLASNYVVWNNYPVQRLNVMFGLKYSFLKD